MLPASLSKGRGQAEGWLAQGSTHHAVTGTPLSWKDVGMAYTAPRPVPSHAIQGLGRAAD